MIYIDKKARSSEEEKTKDNKRKKIKIAISGVGNCASALVQGISYYSRNRKEGLIHPDIKGWKPEDIEIVAAFDIDRRKVGKKLKQAILEQPNCTTIFERNIKNGETEVMMGPVLDGFAEHMKYYPKNRTFSVSDKKPVDVVKVLKESGAEILVNFLPVGSERATRFYADAAIEAGVAFINCIPVFIASDKHYAEKFKSAGLPVIGDDIKSQLGATILHRAIANLFKMRGVKFERTYQLNFGGNTDFLNMLDRSRLKSKKISKTEAVTSVLGENFINNERVYDTVHIGPSDYIPFLNDTKICYIRMEGRGFGGAKIEIDVKLKVEDSPNSAAVVIDTIRFAKVALEEKLSGPIQVVSAFTMKHPPVQMSDEETYEIISKYIRGEGKIW
ncbi:MAG: inositol-3-phosphate synthase [Candidatus Calescibacterium sp.]|nr:inositol-3-phosphate synthase [Candidatus Calescibacterium sp.]MCX7734197.1 inositol-3-phosphate synthase [bacterium]MDW8086541.1 inositol-3-phosphate synthase [Candidatus Calescibacterium sp.]